MNVSPVSFKAMIPVTYYAKSQQTGEYEQITAKYQIEKCQDKVVRTLNGNVKPVKSDTARRKEEKGRLFYFAKEYSAKDGEYRMSPHVYSVYERNMPLVYMLSGYDAYNVQNYAKDIGRVKSDALYNLGRTNTDEVYNTTKSYFDRAKEYINNPRKCARIKDDNKRNLELKVYFNPIMDKYHQIKEFEFDHASFVAEQTNP